MIDIDELTGASKVRTASWEKEAFDRWEKCGVDENGIPQKIQHRVKRFLLSYGTGWRAFQDGMEALVFVDECQRTEYGLYYDYCEEYIPELKGTQAEYVKCILDKIREREQSEFEDDFLWDKPSGFIEANSLTATTTASPEEATAMIQALQARITELEDENEELRANQRNKKQGKQQRGTLGLKACQRIGAFAILLELLTGKDVGILQADGTQNSHLKTLYSEVTNTDTDTTKTYISRLQNRDHQIKEHTRDKIRTELTRLLQAMGIAFGE